MPLHARPGTPRPHPQLGHGHTHNLLARQDMLHASLTTEEQRNLHSAFDEAVLPAVLRRARIELQDVRTPGRWWR